ncbi:MAG: O-antigen ligase family protein [Candidatus Doudnabacteria bacterium]|nr:O-antigen ligase family protein [bacterium]MDZ4243729.1 O-antigen ligase family protein [Candidatus Doudnabacteria bacterium]
MYGFLLIFALMAFAFVAVARRDWALYLTILLLPSYQIRFQIAGIPMTFLECMILLLAVVEFAKLVMMSLRGSAKGRDEVISTRNRLLHFVRNDKPVAILIFLFLGAALISVFTAPDQIKAAGIFKAYFFEAVLFYFLAILIIDDEKKLSTLWKILSVLVLYLSVFGIYQFITLAYLPFNWWAVEVASRRITSLVNHPNALALLVGPLLAMLVFSPEKTKLTWLTLATGTTALYLSFSRAGWLALVVVFLALGLLTQAQKKIIVAGVIAATIVLLIPFSRAKLLDLARGTDLSQQNRYVLWSAATDMIKKSPLLGVGLTGFREAYKNYPLGPDRVVQNYPHNFFLNFWLEVGLLGLISMLGLLILFYKKIFLLFKSNSSPLTSSLALPAAAGMSLILLHGLVDVPYFKNDLSVLFWLIYALPFLQFKAYQSNHSN